MSQTKRISRNTRSLRMKRAETQVNPPAQPVQTPDTQPVREELVRRVRETIASEGLDLDKAFGAAMRRMIEVEIDRKA